MSKNAHYDRIAKSWHRVTGATGGPLKKYVLNELLIDLIGAVEGLRILELGAGNGYFMRLLMRRRSGQRPERLVISDLSSAQLKVAREQLGVPGAEYQQIDLRRRLPFADGSFDLVVASMVLNELGGRAYDSAVAEIFRILSPGGRLLATLTHPEFIARLQKEGQLSRQGSGPLTMPGKGTLRLPVVPRSEARYGRALAAAGFGFDSLPVVATDEVLAESPGLRKAGGGPIALVLRCSKPPLPTDDQGSGVGKMTT